MNRIAAPRPDQEADGRIALAGAIAWPSFFAAGVATMVFFALIDPNELFDIAWPHVRLPRELGYTLGFFVFWAATLGASCFTALLLRRPRDDRE
ncbi:hypothetical protein [Rudaea sp.]|uniref:hypothetical protein n=1 Tax=Rudaea sp. TaxID=2136325 RepID=UPI003784DE1D